MDNTNKLLGIRSVINPWKVLFFCLLIISIGLFTLITYIYEQPDYKLYIKDENPCMIELCRVKGSMEYCFGLEVTDCKVLKEKCEDKEYLEQWDIKCLV